MTATETRTVPFARPWITEEDKRAVLDVLSGHVLTHGPQCHDFEAEFSAFLGPEANSVTVSSCMAALHLAYLHFGVGKGDEVIVPAQTHSATVHAVEWAGATPVFVDCDKVTGNVTPAAIEAALTPKTKAISIVHFVGIPCDMPAIMAIAQKRGLKVIEDCALALGSRFNGKHAGLFGDVGTFSFYPVKHITTGEGGMFVTRHKDVAAAVARLRAFGVDRTHQERSIPGMYDVPSLGLNYRMSEMQAALGRCQLGRFEENLRRRKANFAKLKAAVHGVKGATLLDSAASQAVNSIYCAALVLDAKHRDRRDAVVAKLNAAGIGTSIYYPKPVPRMAYYRTKYQVPETKYPNAAWVSDCGVALPVGPHMTDDDVAYVASTVRRTLEETLS